MRSTGLHRFIKWECVYSLWDYGSWKGLKVRMQIIFAYYINLLICSIIGPVWIHCESIDNVGVQILYRQGRHVLPSVWLMHIYTISNLAETFAQTSDYFSKIT